MTRRDLYSLALEARGYKLNTRYNSGRYKCYDAPDNVPSKRLFLGSSGAVRRGQSVSASHPVNDATKHKLLSEGEHIHMRGNPAHPQAFTDAELL